MLTVHLDAISENYRILKSNARVGADVASVVKADAYGLGAKRIVPVLYEQGCRQFFVAHMAEALDIVDDILPDGRIYVFDGRVADFIDEYQQYENRIIPVLNWGDELLAWHNLVMDMDTPLPYVVHIDTGMNRLGFDLDDLLNLVEKLGVRVEGVISHLACADNPFHEMNQMQLTALRLGLKELKSQLSPDFWVSFANSYGVFLGEEYHFDLLRPGMALYGLNPEPLNAERLNPMRPVVELSAKILQIKQVQKGQNIGYGASYHADRDMRIAVLDWGYADGFFRYLGNVGHVYYNGQSAPVVGRVSMDLITVDVTDIEGEIEVGHWIEIIGKHQSADDLAARAGTIGYEVLTALGARHQVKYISGNES